MSTEKTIAQIEELVVKRMKGRGFFKSYNDGEIEDIIFSIHTDKGGLSFKMPARWKSLAK